MLTGRQRPILATACLALALSGCGGSEEDTAESAPPPEDWRLTADDRRVVRLAQREVADYCADRAAALSPGGPAVADVNPDRVHATLNRLGELARKKPAAEMPDGASVRLALGDIAENLEGTNCDPRLVARIESILAEVPSL